MCNVARASAAASGDKPSPAVPLADAPVASIELPVSGGLVAAVLAVFPPVAVALSVAVAVGTVPVLGGPVDAGEDDRCGFGKAPEDAAFVDVPSDSGVRCSRASVGRPRIQSASAA